MLGHLRIFVVQWTKHVRPLMTPKFPTPTPSLHAALKTRVAEYFDGAALTSKGNGGLYVKAIAISAA